MIHPDYNKFSSWLLEDWKGLLGVTRKSPERAGHFCSPADGRRPEGGWQNMPCPDRDFQVTPRRPSFYSSSLAQISQNRVGRFLPPTHQRRSGCPKHDFLYCIHVNCRRMNFVRHHPMGEMNMPLVRTFLMSLFMCRQFGLKSWSLDWLIY